MKKRIIVLLLTALVFSASGCGKKEASTPSDQPAAEAGDSVYKNENVALAAYKGLSAEKKTYLITDDAIQNEIKSQLSDYADYKSVSRPSQNGDWVYADYKITVNGKVYEESTDGSYYFILGEEEYGPEFDKELTGKSAGDKYSFSIHYEEDYDNSDLAGQTADFEVSILDIQVENLPELTNKFISDTWGYKDENELKEEIRAQLEEQYAQESNDELKEDLLAQVIDASTIINYTQEQYDKAYEYIKSDYENYASMFGMDLNEIYDSFSVSEEDLKQEAMDQLTRELVVSAIIENEHITLSDSEYSDGVTHYAEENGYETEDEFLADYSEEEVRNRLLEDKVLDLLVSNANLTEVEAQHED